MPIIKKLFTFRSFRFFLAGLILIFSTFLLEKHFSSFIEVDKLNTKFLSSLSAKEELAASLIRQLKEEEKKSGNFNTFLGNEHIRDLDASKGISIYKYHNDTLVFWTTNSVYLSRKLLIKEGNSKTAVLLKNGWYEALQEREGPDVYLALILIKHQYIFENNYLKNSFQEDFSIPEGTTLVVTNDTNKKSSPTINNPFLLNPPETFTPKDFELFLLFILYLLSYLFLLISIYHFYNQVEILKRKRFLFLLCFIIDIIIIRFLLFYFKTPQILFDSPLFGPTLYSASNLFPSLGDLLVDSLTYLVISYVVFIRLKQGSPFETTTWSKKIVIVFLSLMVIIGGMWVCYETARSLIIHSTIPFSLQNITTLNAYSLIGFFILSSIFLSYLLLLNRAMEFLLSIFATYQPITRFIGIFSSPSASKIVIPLLLLSIASTFVFNHFNEAKERQRRELIAIKLSMERDPVAEMLFTGVEKKIIADKILQSYYKSDSLISRGFTEDSLSAHLTSTYFGELWSNYSIQITFCPVKKFLRIQPRDILINCKDYFSNIIEEYGEPVSTGKLYYLDYGYGFKNYIAALPLIDHALPPQSQPYLYIEISSKSGYRDQGYPELLVDKKFLGSPDMAEYSYAFYRDRKLMHTVGPISFSFDLDHTVRHITKQPHFYIHKGIDHLCYPIDSSNVLVISRTSYTILDRLAPFSYLLIFFSFFTLLFYLTVGMPYKYAPSRLKFSERLQITMTSIILSSLLLICFLVVYYLILLNHRKNTESLSERAHSMLVEIQHKLGGEEDLAFLKPDELNELLVKFSNVFFCDVNLYSTKGLLIASSRPQIFDEGLISKRINPIAWYNLKENHSSLFILDESIGSNHYSSAYIPFYNDKNKLLGYLNLPYFVKQQELKREISSFLAAFINVYAFLVILGFFVALIVSNYITRPLKLLTLNLGQLTLGKSNQKLTWKREDEVGRLVAEYNRKIDELAKSAELLAKSERESAWREMARQIAHEIKNPLTPMKLGTQYLLKSWQENAPDMDSRIRKFSDTMIEQIDSLASIASAFSDFARIPESEKEEVNIVKLITQAISLHDTATKVKFSFNYEREDVYVLIDKKQLSRVFTNLFTNSIQAIGEKADGKITISMDQQNGNVVVSVMDNGAGISPEVTEKIFQPYFTTKSGGVGLGLAIVKNIIESSGGQIRFESTPEMGTKFTIELPEIPSSN